jgi:pimeloyl-ACP methyl ester carboxylesterase
MTLGRHDAWLEQRVGSACRKRSRSADTFDTDHAALRRPPVYDLPGASHFLQMENSGALAGALGDFFARH